MTTNGNSREASAAGRSVSGTLVEFDRHGLVEIRCSDLLAVVSGADNVGAAGINAICPSTNAIESYVGLNGICAGNDGVYFVGANGECGGNSSYTQTVPVGLNGLCPAGGNHGCLAGLNAKC